MSDETHQEARGEGSPPEADDWASEVLEARHQLLTMRDHVIGTEAEVGRLNRDLAESRFEQRRAKRQLKALMTRRDDLRERLQAANARTKAAQDRATDLRRQLDAQLAMRGSPSFAQVIRRLRREPR